jgi:general secretion pathway protein C
MNPVAVSVHAVQLALGRYFWAINLVFVACFAYVGASLENVFVAELIRPAPKVVTGNAAPAPKPVKHAELTPEDLARLMGAKLPEAPPPEEAAQDAKAPDMTSEPIRTSLHAQLLATVLANRPEWSIATIKDLNQNETKICMIGDVFMGADVLDIQYLRVILLVDGHREFLDLSAPPSTVAVAPKAEGEPAPPPTGEGIKKLSENRYQIERSTVNNALANMNDLAMQARIVPSFKNGQPNGFKLFSIRPDSLYAKIGIQNGDVIQRLNGFDMNSPDKALEAYTKLKSANAIDMQVERNGQTVNYHYGIQ